jgi:hypothetical protein
VPDKGSKGKAEKEGNKTEELRGGGGSHALVGGGGNVDILRKLVPLHRRKKGGSGCHSLGEGALGEREAAAEEDEKEERRVKKMKKKHKRKREEEEQEEENAKDRHAEGHLKKSQRLKSQRLTSVTGDEQGGREMHAEEEAGVGCVHVVVGVPFSLCELTAENSRRDEQYQLSQVCVRMYRQRERCIICTHI